jgi:hypothetical protein
MIKLDNFLPNSYARDLERELTSPSFPWNWNSKTVVTPMHMDELTTDSQQLTHVMVHQQEQVSQFYPLIYPMLYFLEQHTGQEYSVWRAKSNMLFKDATFPVGHYNTQHRDTPPPSNACSLLYYVNNSDGDTVFFDEEHKRTTSVTPKRNTAILFDSTLWHASTPPTHADNRIVINFIMEPK